ncbi:hypothetical protein KY362_00070, partial [Candidatus Woesearchaeota archaeon]|nr:hypothetical protein [Candidatus Woesearchaeota archaeon]
PLGTLYLWLAVKSVENISFYKHVDPRKLTEGDWIAKDIIINRKRICGPKDLGISREQIATLAKLKKKGKVKKVLVKNGFPFVPSFLLAFIATYLWGNIVFNLVGL